MEIARLTDDDWGDLLPGYPVTLGKTTIVIKPLGIADLKDVSTKIQAIMGGDIDSIDIDSEAGINALFNRFIEHAPEVLEMATGVHRDDIKRLPIGKGVELVKAAIEANLNSGKSLRKNFLALGAMLKGTAPTKA